MGGKHLCIFHSHHRLVVGAVTSVTNSRASIKPRPAKQTVTLRDEGRVLGPLPGVSCGGLAVVQVFQESTPDFVSACALLNQGVCHEVPNLPHEAGDEHTSDLIGIEMLHFTTV